VLAALVQDGGELVVGHVASGARGAKGEQELATGPYPLRVSQIS
jgi:hypothetical protein